MACITLLAPPVAMATTQFACKIPCHSTALPQEQSTKLQTLRMNWVVVTAKNGTRSLRVQWDLGSRSSTRPAQIV
jgi:hypothetical protein